MNVKKNSLYSIRLDTGTPHDVSEDFSLPDYLPEVRQILACSASVIPENKYIDQSEIILSGIISYSVFYVGDDGNLTCVPLNSEYSVRIPCSSADVSGLSAEMLPGVTYINSHSCRATGPRRLTLSSRMTSKVISAIESEYKEDSAALSPEGSVALRIAEEMSLERRQKVIRSGNITSHSATGNVTGDVKSPADSKLISCQATVGISDIRNELRDVVVKGNVYVSCLFRTTDGAYVTSTAKAPLEERLRTSYQSSGSGDDGRETSASIRCAGISVSSKDSTEHSWSVEYDVDVLQSYDRESFVTDDIYSTKYETVSETTTLHPMICLKNTLSRLSVNGTKQLSGGADKAVCQTLCRVSTDRTEHLADGKLVISGSCTAHVLINDSGTLTAEEVTFPYRYECDCKRTASPARILHNIGVMYCDSRLEGNKLTVDVELNVSVLAYTTCDVDCISSCAIDRQRPIEKSGSCIKIYYPSEGEGIWDIGKKYHCEADKIQKSENGSPVMIYD